MTRVIIENNDLSYRTQFCLHHKQRFVSFNASSLSEYPKHPTARNAISKRVRVPAGVIDQPVSDITVDTAIDVPCVAEWFVRQHPTKKNTEMLAVPRNAINLRSAGGSQLEILGYIRFMLTIGDTKFHTNNSSRSAPSGYSSCGYQCRVGASVSNQEMLHVTTT